MNVWDEIDNAIKYDLPESTVDVVAAGLTSRLRRDAPRALAEWLDEVAPSLIGRLISDRVRAQRARAQRAVASEEFRRAVDAGEVAEWQTAHTVSTFDQLFVVADDDTRRRLGDMTGVDHRYVADRYKDSARRSVMAEAVHRELARLCGKRRTEDVITEEKYAALLRGGMIVPVG